MNMNFDERLMQPRRACFFTGGPANDPSVIDLKAERIKREREASERRHVQRHAYQPESAA